MSTTRIGQSVCELHTFKMQRQTRAGTTEAEREHKSKRQDQIVTVVTAQVDAGSVEGEYRGALIYVRNRDFGQVRRWSIIVISMVKRLRGNDCVQRLQVRDQAKNHGAEGA